VHLTLVLQNREPGGSVCQSPLPCLVVDGKSDKLDQRWTLDPLRTILPIRGGVPDPCEIDLRECRDASEQHHAKKSGNHNSGSISAMHVQCVA